MRISYFTECTVLITGASAGIGYEFARQLAPVAGTMVLVARRKDRLETLKSDLQSINPRLKLFSRPVDLRDKNELERFCDWLDQSDLTIDLLINNAGLGDHGPFVDSEWERVNSMLQVNVYALTYLTFRVLPGMLPLPNSAVYAATKAYVTNFSEAIRAELRLSNISVTALCPGPVSTEFLSLATRGGDHQSHTAPDSFIVSVQEVVRQGLEAVTKHRARVVPGAIVNLAMTMVAFLPMFIKRLVYNARVKRGIVSGGASDAPPAERH